MSSSQHVLILTNVEDYHAFVISECLQRKDISYSLWYAADFPSLQKASVWLGGAHENWSIRGPELSLSPRSSISSVWLRRPGRPMVPEDLDSNDLLFAGRECQAFLTGIRRFVGAKGFWVNPPAGFARANLKIEQLRSAVRNGFRIPETLMSNDPAEILAFVRGKPGGVVYKTFFPFSWRSPGGMATAFCSPVSVDDLPEDSVLAAVPGIYQERVEKAFEIRVTAIGGRLFAVKLHSQEVPSAHLDWRAATEHVPLEPFTLPVPVARACRAVMEDLGIVFGCFDLIVTPAGDYVFLEVNEAGAFLWLEAQLPELHLADAFCDFICEGKEEDQISSNRPKVKLADVHDAALRRMRDAALLHPRELEEVPVESSLPAGTPDGPQKLL